VQLCYLEKWIRGSEGGRLEEDGEENNAARERSTPPSLTSYTSHLPFLHENVKEHEKL